MLCLQLSFSIFWRRVNRGSRERDERPEFLGPLSPEQRVSNLSEQRLIQKTCWRHSFQFSEPFQQIGGGPRALHFPSSLGGPDAGSL